MDSGLKNLQKRVQLYAEQVLGNQATAWLSNYNPAIQCKPSDLIKTEDGCLEVLDLLGRIEHGMYS